MAEEIISFEFDFGNGVEKIENMAQAGKRFGEALEDIRTTVDETLPGMSTFLDMSEHSFRHSIQSIDQTQRRINEGKIPAYRQDAVSTKIHNQRNAMMATMEDVRTFAALSREVSKLVEDVPVMRKALIDELPSLMTRAREIGTDIAKSGSVYLLRNFEGRLFNEYRNSNKFEHFTKSGFTEEAFRTVLRYAAMAAVPQYQRGEYMGRLGGDPDVQKHDIASFREMLPKAFAKIPAQRQHRTQKAFEDAFGNDTMPISVAEMKKLRDIITENRYLTDAAVATGAAKKINGQLLLNGHLNRGMVNAIAGNLMDDIVSGAKGMPMYGIQDVEDPENWTRIARKTNKQMKGALRAAHLMQENFGEWLAPDYYTEDQLQALVNKTKPSLKPVGKLKFSPRTKSFEVAQYTADDLARGLSWNNGGTYDKAEDYHHITVDDSIQLRKIMKYGSGIKPHNSYTDDVVYFKIDERLADPNVSDETRAQIKSEIAKVWEHGFTVDGPSGSKLQYVATRVNPKMGIELVRKEIHDRITADDPTFFSAGLERATFDPRDYEGSPEQAWKAYAAAMEYRNKNATPGENIQDLFGVDFFTKGRTPNIAVVDIPDLDGASMIHNRYVPTGFQGRMTGVKSALMPLNIGAMTGKYGGSVMFNRATGDGTVAIDDTVDIILNKKDIKNFDERFAGKSYEEIVAAITEDLRKDGMSALRTYGDADTPTRWISAQLAQTMQMTEEDVAMFNKAFMDEMLKLNSYSYVKDTVFAQDSELHDILEKNPQMFHTKEVQDRIRDYQMSMIHRKSQGDLFIPQGIKAHKAMAAPWVVDVFNKAIEAAGGTIPDEMRELSLLGGNEADPLKERVVFLKALTEFFGLARYPAAPGSIQVADNAAVGVNKEGKVTFAESFKKFANEVGLSEDALYFAPGSRLMEYMQSEDFDGDVNEIIEFARNPETTEEALMQKIFEVTMRHGQEVREKVAGVDLEARKRGLERSTLQTKGVDVEKLKAKIYRIAGEGSGEDVARFIEEYAKSSTAMGVPNAVLRNAYQMQMTRDVALAMYDAIEQYDTNSTQGKKAITRLTSLEERDVLGKYKPFSEFFHMLNKATDENGEIDYSRLQGSNIWKTNLPSMHASGNMRSALLSRFMAKQWGLNVNMGYDWDKFFEFAGGQLDADSKTGELTPVGLMQAALRDVYKGYLNADYLTLSSEDKVALDQLRQDAIKYELARVEQDMVHGRLSEEEKKITGKPGRVRDLIAQRRVDDVGGMVIANIGAYAATEDNVDGDYYLMSDLYDYGYRDSDVFSRAGLVDKYLGKGRKVVSDPGSRRILSLGDIERNRGLLHTLRETLSPDQMRGRLNNVSFTPTTLAAFASNPEEWILDKFAEPGTRPQRVDTDQIKLGKATEDAIQGFMRLRQQASQAGRMLTQEELEKARDRAVEDLDTYLRDGVSGKEGYAGLSESTFKEVTAGRGKVGVTYQGVKKWLQEKLLDFMPESEYMVTGIERTRKFEHADLGKTMPTENNPDEAPVKMTGRSDVEFTSRKTGGKTVVDFKVHDAQSSPEQLLANFHKAVNQLQQYALSDEARSGNVGETIEGLKVLMPAIDKVFDVDASEEALAERASAISEAIKVIQSLPESGLSPAVIKSAGQRVGELLFGITTPHSGASYEQYLKQDKEKAFDESKERMNAMIDKSSLSSIGSVLTLHEDYKDSLESLARFEKFANQKLNGDNRQIYNQWSGAYDAIERVRGDAESLRSQGMFAEADRLDMARNTLKNNLDSAIIKSATADYEKFYDILHAINTEMQVSKSASERIEFYRNISQQAALAAQAHSELDAQIKNIDEDIANNRSIANALKKAAEAETDEEKKKQTEEDAKRVEAYIEKQKARKTAFETASEEAAKKKPQAEAEYAAFKSKFVSDTFSYYDEIVAGFGDIRSGGRKSGLTSIAEDVEAYVKSVKQAVVDLNQMNTDGLFETDADKKRYASMIEQMTAAYSPEAQQEYAKTLITSSLSDAQNRMLALRASISDTPISAEDQIKMAVAKKSEEMKLAKMDLQKRLGAADLSDDEKKQYNDLLSFYDSFDPAAYQTRLTEQARLDNELQEARRARRTERLLTNGRKLQRDPFGIRSNNFLDRAEERRDAAVDRYDNLIENYKVEIKKREATMASSDVNSDAYKKAADDIEKMTEALHSAEDASKSLAGAGGIASAAFAQMGESVTRVIQQFGRQMFHQAANEVKRFVQQYNADMTTIQMITLKTDEEISNLGADLIDTAIDLKVSVSDVTTAASEIYRQGLTDEEVDVRLEDTMKFSKVAGIKAEEASKILTTAMTNGLVETSEEAMDALVALDDSVATSASEIAKGMQKSAASAKEAGMSYQELVTSLAIITSRTQLGGSSAGTALSTLMYRLYKVGLGEDVYDENGNHIASTKMTQALDSIGVDMFENGQFRGPYQILVDIAKNWESADDIQREQILSTLGAGRQRANMATLIQGLAEDDGALAESYIDLATNSQGITDEKYLIYLESLDAALNSVQSSFDKLIASFNVDGATTAFLDFIAEMIQGLTAANEATGGAVVAIVGLIAVLTSLASAFKANPLFMGGIAAAGVVAGVASSFAQAQAKNVEADEIADTVQRLEDDRREMASYIESLKELNESTDKSAENQAKLDAGMQVLATSFSSVNALVDDATGKITNYAAALELAAKENENLTNAEKYRLLFNNANVLANAITEDGALYSSETSPLFAENVDFGRMGYTVHQSVGSDLQALYDAFGDSEAARGYLDRLGWSDTSSFDGADKETQETLYRLARLLQYRNRAANPSDFVPEAVFKMWEEDGRFANGAIAGYSGSRLDANQVKTILADGTFASLGVGYSAYGDKEVAAIRKHVFNLIAEGIVNDDFDQIKTDGIDGMVQTGMMQLFTALFPELEVDAEALNNALSRRVKELFESSSSSGNVASDVIQIIIGFIEGLFNDDYSINQDFVNEYITDDDRPIWKYTDSSGNTTMSLTRAEAEALWLQEPLSRNDVELISEGSFTTKSGEVLTEDQLFGMLRAHTKGIFRDDADMTEDEIEAMAEDAVLNYEDTDFFREVIDHENASGYRAFDGSVFASKSEAENYVRNKRFSLPVLMTEDDFEKERESEANKPSLFGDALSAAKRLYETQNETAFKADTAISEIINDQIVHGSAKTLEHLASLIDDGKLPSLTDLMRSDENLATLFSKYVRVNEDGTRVYDETGYAEVMRYLASISTEYQGAYDLKRSKKVDAAEIALERILAGDSAADIPTEELQKYLGDSLYKKLSAKGLTPEEEDYARMLLRNERYGIDGLTEQQQLMGAQDVMNWIQEGTMGLHAQMDEGMLSAYSSGITSLPQLMQMANVIEGTGLGITATEFAEMTPESEGYEQVAAALEKSGFSAEGFLEVLKEVNKELSISSIKAANKYDHLTDKVIENIEEWGDTTEDQINKQKSLNAETTKAANSAYYRQQFRAGDRTKETKASIAEQTGFNEDQLDEYEDEILKMLDQIDTVSLENIQSELDAMSEQTVFGPDITIQPGTIASDEAMAILAQQTDGIGARLHQYLQTLMNMGAEVQFVGYTDENGKAGVRPIITKMPGTGAGFKPSGGGGGGGGGNKKSSAEKLMESQDREQTIRDHIIKMIQYEETMYKNADELTNYGIMLQHEIDEEERQVQAKQANIAALKEEIAKTEKLSDEWYELRDAIMKAEEEVKDLQNTIDENLEALKENQQAILKLHTDLEQTVKEEIENRIAREEDMLSASVEMQDIVVEAIRHRYQEEWELMQEDIDKKKEALQEEIALIDERLQRRKDAEDEAEKYKQLAEYKRQLSLISMDSTRTADQATLREKIAELEKEIAWDTAEDQAEAQKESLQEQVDAYDEYVNDYQEYLDDLLEDANNFADEVNGVMSLNQQQLFEWLKENVEEYSNSLDDAQEQMVNSWEDTFKRMKGITDTYWQEIASVLTSKDSFLEYMKQSQSYLNASEDERKQMIYSWETMYDNYISATKVSQEAVDWTHSDDYATDSSASSSGSSGKTYRTNYTVYKADGTPYNGYGVGSTQSEADSNAAALKQAKLSNGYFATKPQTATTATSVSKNNKNFSAVQYTDGYSDGGYVDYTGLAIVHGTPSKPEAFLSAEDTSMIRGLLDSWKYVKARSFVSNLDSLFQGGQNNNIGEVNVVINQAELKEDADFEEVARRVGEVFTKELAKQGFSTAAYAL